MAQMVMQRLLAPSVFDPLCEAHRGAQYEHKLLFPVLVELMIAVVFGCCPSVHKAYPAATSAGRRRRVGRLPEAGPRQPRLVGPRQPRLVRRPGLGSATFLSQGEGRPLS
ncbi:MAG: hypothetical protein RMJ98_02575 [Myxococcales bacterium]|nr:hypothetical protein [Myxococcales bacterium]